MAMIVHDGEIPLPYPLDDALRDRIDNDFRYHAPSAEAAKLTNATSQGKRYNEIRGLAGEYARFLAWVCPPSRELSLAFTNLDQVVFWANAAIARHETAPEGANDERDEEKSV